MISRQSERALAYLKRMPMLAGYSFSIFTPGLTETPESIDRMLCDAQGMSHLCEGICIPFLTAVSGEALAGRKSIFLRCPRSHSIFAVPLSADACLVCCGELAADTGKKAQETILKIERIIASFVSRERTRPINSAQPPFVSHEQRGQQRMRH